MSMPPQDNDQDMADFSSPTNLKRGQLTIQQSIQQKKTKSDIQSEHHKYANQDIWLGFQTMELLAIDNDTPPQDVHTSIRELIRRGYRENEAAEIHTARISFSRIP
jgi:SOS response regulatory protein OraA/RecX